MMKTKEVLKKKSLVACAYFLLSAILVLVILWPTQQTRGLSIINQTNVFPATLLLIAAIMYFIHFIYGTIYYSNKYFKIMALYGTKNEHCVDLSAYRGYFATALVILAFGLGHLSFWYWYIYLAWIAINLLLTKLTKTSHLFHERAILIDEAELMDWKKPDKTGHRNKCISFLFPVLEDWKKWKQQVITIYIGEEANLWQKR